MTRKDYIDVAALINEAWPNNRKQRRPARLGFFITGMARLMKNDNEAFDSDRFMRACGEWMDNSGPLPTYEEPIKEAH